MQTASIQQMDTCNVNNLTKQVSFLNLNENQVNTVEENTESPLTSPRYFPSMFVPFAKTAGLRVGSVNPNEMNDDELAEYFVSAGYPDIRKVSACSTQHRVLANEFGDNFTKYVM